MVSYQSGTLPGRERVAGAKKNQKKLAFIRVCVIINVLTINDGTVNNKECTMNLSGLISLVRITMTAEDYAKSIGAGPTSWEVRNANDGKKWIVQDLEVYNQRMALVNDPLAKSLWGSVVWHLNQEDYAAAIPLLEAVEGIVD